MPEPRLAKYKSWSKDRLYKAAIAKVLNDGWTQSEAAAEFGISRQNLNKRVKEAKAQRAVRVEEVKEQARVGPLGLNEKRRIGTFPEFVDHYLKNWSCPDCGVHHDTPNFHLDIAEAVTGDYRRVLINMPPYHSKSTLSLIHI